MVFTPNNVVAGKEVKDEIAVQLKLRSNIDTKTIGNVSDKVSENLCKSLADEFLKPSGDDANKIPYDPERRSIATHKYDIAEHVVKLIESKRSIFSKVFDTKISISKKQIDEISEEVTKGFKEKAIEQVSSGFPQGYETSPVDRQLIEKLALNANELYNEFKSDSQHKSRMESEFPGKDLENLEILINKFSSRDTLDNHRDPKNIKAFKDFKHEVAKLINIDSSSYRKIHDENLDKETKDINAKLQDQAKSQERLSPELRDSARRIGAAIDRDIEHKQAAKSYIKPETEKPLSIKNKIVRVFRGKTDKHSR